MTTFITPFGRFAFNRLPFGISSAPEIFHRHMSQMLEGMEGVVCHMDDILVHGTDQIQHDARVRAVLQCLHAAGLTLNNKCEFSKTSIKFLGHIIDASGIHAASNKTAAIAHFPAPTNVAELQRFMGMVNQMGKFIPRLAEINKPLRQLLCKDTAWLWEASQETAFQQVKDMPVSPEILAHYDPDRPTVIAADASSEGIGAVLLQIQDDGRRRPVCYASRSLTDTEKRYAVIEKEALAATWACEKFREYVMGLSFTLETDHKPLVPLLKTTELAKMPPRIQRFRMRLMRYSSEVAYVPGNQQTTPDAISRAPVNIPEKTDVMFLEEVEHYATNTVTVLPATEKRLQDICTAQKDDEVCAEVRLYCHEGWPAFMPQIPLLLVYWESRSHIAIVNDLLLYDERIVMPRCMRLDILKTIHEGHLGISKCRSRANQAVWWPGLSKQIEEMVSACHTCAKVRPEPKETLMSASFPSRPWERVGVDLFELHGKVYIVIVDYYSRWVEHRKLTSLTSEHTIEVLKEVFATHGIPDLILTDNGPQFSAESFAQFTQSYCFTHTTSSPRFPQANGEAERAVKILKEILRKNEDPHLALLTQRTTPLLNGLSPSQLLMGRRLPTRLPVIPSTLLPGVTGRDLHNAKTREAVQRAKQQQQFNSRHRAKDLTPLQPGDNVWVRDQDRYGTVVERAPQPRSSGIPEPKHYTTIITTTEYSTVAWRDTHTIGTRGKSSKSP